MANENNKIKLLLLWDILSKNTDENHAMNADEIREELAKRGISVMRKVIADDIAVLNEYGYEVLSYKKKYYYYYVVSRPIETAEVVMLADAVNASKLPATQKKALVERLSSFLCSHQAESVSKHIISFEKSRKGSSSFIYNVDAIEHAINENKQISFLYFNYDEKHKKVYRKDGKRYVVSPAYMVWNKDNYYLLCFSNGYADLVTYRLDKMDDVKVDETEREPHPEYEKFNTDEYRKQVFSMFGGELCNVTLLFEPSILSDMFDRFGDDIRIRKVDDNAYSVDVSVQVSKTLFAWIVGTQGTKDDLDKDHREQFVSKVAMGDWDSVIIAQSSFAKINISPERQIAKIQEEIAAIERSIEMQWEDSNSPSGSVKNLERIKKGREAQLKKLLDESKKDNVLIFEKLGVDYLFVDEADAYKNLFLYTKMNNVAGISNAASARASDLQLKIEYINELHGGDKGVVFATGTPISNSMTEMYTMQTYLQKRTLEKLGIDYFDAWAADFGETVTALELAPSGKGYRARTRFAKFTNLPELLTLYHSFADVKTDVKLDVPEAERKVITLKPSDTVIDLTEEIAKRADAIYAGGVDPHIDNMLKVTGDGKKLALDPRCIDPLLSDESGSKLNFCADNVYEEWKNSADIKGTQLVFCDLSTPKKPYSEYEYGKNFDAYNDLKHKLIERGIPENEIAFIHDANTDKAKQDLFDKVTAGTIRVLIGSTEKCGAGTNVQKRLVALHHLDAPYSRTGSNMLFEYNDLDGNTYVIFFLWNVIGYKVKVCEYDENPCTTHCPIAYFYHADGTQDSTVFGVLGNPHVSAISPCAGLTKLFQEIKIRLLKLDERDLSQEYLQKCITEISNQLQDYQTKKISIAELLDFEHEDRIIPVYILEQIYTHREEYRVSETFYQNMRRILQTNDRVVLTKETVKKILNRYLKMDSDGTFITMLKDAFVYFHSTCCVESKVIQ